MSETSHLGQEEPLFTLGDFPVRLITLLVAFHSMAMIGCALLIAANHGAWLDHFVYSSADVAHGQVWRLMTYAFVATPDIWFLFQMLMLYYFGKEVEHGLGWQRFAVLYAGLTLLGPLLLQAFGYGGLPQIAAGAQAVNFSVFAAFVAMHPGAQFFFGVAARWVLVALLSLLSLQYLAAHEFPKILVLISSSLMAIMMMRRSGFQEPLFGWGFQWALPSFSKSKSPFQVVQGGISASAKASSTPNQQMIHPEVEMDRLLEKISSKGMESLSREERTTLEKARQAMLQRERR